VINALKTLAKAALGGWSVYRIFERQRAATPMAPPVSTFRFSAVGAEAVANCPDPLLSRDAWYCGNGSHAFACYEGVRSSGTSGPLAPTRPSWCRSSLRQTCGGAESPAH
jgi:hypothetical protein